VAAIVLDGQKDTWRILDPTENVRREVLRSFVVRESPDLIQPVSVLWGDADC